ncbi:TLD-domain-containing protein [Phanerochaete sordida]|uniref:Oxidation resistance protein 1 n=1 Tax=Phanerochaete sordida TaxID=48140 RepID=A0A9P3GIF0_9APHY|nr:TLD-domain-containing protein [Phanerochaete sordida]
MRGHSRASSTDSEFGSFVSVPSAEDPLHQLGSDAPQLFSPVQNFGFFDRFTEEAKAATEKNKKGVLDELLKHEDDPLYFLRSATPTATQQGRDTPEAPSKPAASEPDSATSSTAPSGLTDDVPPQPLISFGEQAGLTADETFAMPGQWSQSLPSTSATGASAPRAPSSGLLDELIDYEENHRSLPSAQVASTSRSATPQPQRVAGTPLSARSSRHPSREANRTEPDPGRAPSSPTRSPSLPPTPMRLSDPEVQRTQSFFMPTSLTASAFPTKWVSSLLSRTAPQAPPGPIDGLPTRAATAPDITHGTPFASHPFVPPSGAPGFAGDRAWDKGFEFDKENVERASVRLVGRKEGTHGVLNVALADKLRPHLPALKRLPRAWTLLYSLDQHGISLNTLYTRCAAHTGGALLVIRDSNDVVFGAWMGEGIHMSKGAYYGSGESFLWKLMSEDKLRVFKWTGRNEYVALCEPEYISFGGGEGHYGLYVDATLMDGSSAHCPTFDNEPLCSPGPRQGEGVTFECVGLEVWGIGG